MAFTRLFEQFKPSSYNLKLELDKQKLNFKGQVDIVGVPKASTKKIKLHAKNLTIKQASLNNEVAEISLGDNDELVLASKEAVAGQTTIRLIFSGKITKPMHGLYPCYAKNGDIILATQFESHHAREVFPCIDEPEAKAVFDLELTTDKNEVVLGNMPVNNQTETNNKLITSFSRSPVMSTYLLAFVVGPLHSVSTKTKNGTEVNIWASKDHSTASLEFALGVASRATDFFNDYFSTPYPLPKCDHVALPDFSSGAMENWGLITYREVCLVVEPNTTSAQVQEFAGTVICHELSHQWFGNLVTMKWWDDLWLNESFATLMEYLAVDALFPEWQVMQSFAAHEALGAFRRDTLKGVQAVQTTVNHPDEISTLFDPSIVYAKGARLLFMAYNLVGEAAFKKALRRYFEKYAYKNTVGDNLWDELAATSKIAVKVIMNSWISTPGFPVLIVDQNKQQTKLTQKKFETIDTSPSSELWPIPLFSSPAVQPQIFDQRTTFITSKQEPFIFNSLGGHYSVKYLSSLSTEYIEKMVASKKLSATKRLFYLNDILLQARSGIGSIISFMETLAAYKTEDSEPVWSVISLGLADVKRLIENNEPAEQALKTLTYQIIEQEYLKLGWVKQPTDSYNAIKLRELAIALALYSENPAVIKKAQSVFASYQISGLPSNERGVILSAVVKHGSPTVFNKLFNEYSTQTNSEIKQDICGALTSTKNAMLAEKILANLKNEDWVKKQDIDRFIVSLLANKWTKAIAWKWLTRNWSWIEKSFASDKSYDNYPRYAASTFNNQEWLEKYQQFFGPKKNIVALKRNIKLGELEIKNRIKWAKRDQKKLVKWLENQPNQAQ